MVDHYAVKIRAQELNGIGLAVEHFSAYLSGDDSRSLHTHDVVELAYIHRGHALHRIGDGVATPALPGSLVVVHYTQAHVIETGPDPVTVTNLYLDLERFALPDLGEELSGALYAILPMHASLKHRRSRCVTLRLEPGGAHEGTLAAMLAEQDARRPGHRAALGGLFRLFLIDCARAALSAGALPVAEVSESQARVEALRRALDLDPAQPVSVAALAARMHWSVPHLCRAFRRHTGMPLLAYLRQRRVHAAMVRLRSSSESVLEVALACGFADASYFTRVFRRLVGATPSAYRERAR